MEQYSLKQVRSEYFTGGNELEVTKAATKFARNLVKSGLYVHSIIFNVYEDDLTAVVTYE